MKRLAFLILLVVLIFISARIALALTAPSGAVEYPGYWHTDGTRIVDTSGQTVHMAGVTWYGMESSYWVPAGLDYQPYTSIMDLVKSLRYNTIRLPFSNELVESNPIVTSGVAANPQFKGGHAMTVMDAIVNYAQKIGLKLILDDHRSHAARPNQVNFLDEGLWYTRRYPESSWIRDWVSLARRYQGNDAVIGFDLRNEPHTDGPGPWSLQAYLHQGATWGPYPGYNTSATDWRLAAERAGNAVLHANPHLLMFVEGVQLYPDSTTRGGVATYWWGSILQPVARYPVIFKVPHQLVYSAHDWGPHKWYEPWFNKMTYRSMERIWYRNWSFIVQNKKASYAAPLWLGEFGTCNYASFCVDAAKGKQGHWFQLLLRYLKSHPNVGWSFYALNGTNSNDHRATNGLLNADWSDVASPLLQNALASVQP